MVVNIEIEGQNVELLPEWRTIIDKQIQHLERRAGRRPMTNLRLEVIATPHHRHGAFEVRLMVKHTKETLQVSRAGENVVPAINEAFAVMERRLDEHLSLHQGPVEETEPVVEHGKIQRFYPERFYGFIRRDDGAEVYFHLNAVKKGSVDDLLAGATVRFNQEDGEHGPQATWVRVD